MIQKSKFDLQPHEDPHTKKIFFDGVHVGNVKSELRTVYQAVGNTKLEPVFRVTSPEGFEGKYNSSDFTNKNKALVHAFIQHSIGSMK